MSPVPSRAFEDAAGGIREAAADCEGGQAAGEEGVNHSQAAGSQGGYWGGADLPRLAL